MHLRAMVATPDGKRIARAEINGEAAAPEALGQQIASLLEAQDARSILAECKTDE
jgi:hydroxymethylbilane synthase